MVKVYTTLNQNKNDESFAIDNVKFSGASGGGTSDLDYETSSSKKGI